MLRRLYYMFPSTSEAQAAVRELIVREGIQRRKMHAIARDGVVLGDLPGATVSQRHDLRARIANWLWSSDPALFWLALVGLLVALYYGQIFWAVPSMIVMLGTFLAGAWYTLRIPDTSLREFRDSFAHGEVLLMVDVPKHKVVAVEKCIARHHHTAVAGGSSWTLKWFGI